MRSARDRAALVALLRLNRRPWPEYVAAVERTGSALAVLEAEFEGAADQLSLLAAESEPLLDRAAAEIQDWNQAGFQLLSILDEGYPRNLRLVADRPPLIFISGDLTEQDARSLAVIGARRATPDGIASATAIAAGLVGAGYVVVSGLAAGVDTAAHRAAQAAGGRTIAVIGTGLRHAYPSQNASLQKRIAAEGAVISQFWPETPPSRETFPMRNAVMSGVALGTVVVQASHRSGARLQARLALAQGRPVFLVRSLLAQTWAREMAAQPDVHVIDGPEQVISTIERRDASDAPVE